MTANRHDSRRRRVLIVAAASIAALGLSASPAAADPDDGVSDIEEQIEDEAFDLEETIEEYNAVKEDLDDLEGEIEDLEETLAPYEEELDALYDKSEGITVAAYQQQGLDSTVAVLDAGSPDVFAAKMSALDGISAGDAEVISEINDVKSDYDEDLEVLEDLKADADELADDLSGKKETIETAIERLQDDRREAYRDERGDGDAYIPDYVPGDRGVVVQHAMDQLNDPYVWAADGPDGYDCSGLMKDAYAQLGIGLSHNAARQYEETTRIDRDQLQPGDLVFYNSLQHVAMYIGDDYVIHAPTFGDVVKIQTVDAAATPYYGAGRLL
ncbi:MAG: NlpC/P60 family protein [Stackebrandtia sp.]